MMKLLVLAVSTAVASAVPASYVECKHYKFCCDNEICTNNCASRPVCDPMPHQGVPWMPVAIGICESYFGYDCSQDAICCGDPHFRTWGGEWFDFQGECDLNFVHAPSFGKGLGLDIHVRTKIRSDFSYIEAAAIKIGDDVFELGGWGEYLINGVDAAKSDKPQELSSFPITHETIDEATHIYHIFIGEHQSLEVKSYKDYVSVKFENANSEEFGDSTGILGDFVSGKRFGRDGTTVISDDIDYGMEWQVRHDTEGQLFQSTDLVPQYPQKCNMPPMTAEGRRLAEFSVSKEDAEAACAHMDDAEHKRMCVFDVQSTGDLSVAQHESF